MNDSAIPTNTFTFKADVASSEGANNVVLAQIYNDLCPTKTPLQVTDSRVRQTIDGHPIVIFWNDTTVENNTLKFLGKYNFNNDKGTEEVFGFTDGDESWEIRQNGTERVGWRSDDYESTDNSGNPQWLADFEARFPEDNMDVSNLKALATWLKSTDTAAATNTQLNSPVTYGGVTYTADTAEYRLAKFKAELSDHADVQDMIFYYLFTEIFLCIDQREKNAFPTLFEDMGKWIMFFYDADSSLGIDNKGKLAFDYYLEDIDYNADGSPVYNGQASVLWVNLRNAFYPEIQAMYRQLRTELRNDGSGDRLISYEVVNKLFENHQSKWCEAIFNEDMSRKCLEPYILSGDDDYIDMLLGKKEMHRKWWLYNRFRYLDSKYETGNSMDTRLMIRAKGKSNLVLTSYVDMYGRVYYNSEMVEHRMTRGQEYEFVWAASGAEDAVVGVNDADMITSLGDLSPLQVETINIANATHLTALKIGDGASTYVNNALTSVGFGNNVLLRSLDLRNCVALTQSLDASGCSNIEEVLCDGSSITGIALPNGGIIKTLHLPSTITNLTVLNQTNITDFSMPNYDNLTTLRIENCPAIATDYIILHAPNLNRVRLLDVDWNIMDETFLERLDSCRGKDENNLDVDRPVITGRAVINVPVSESMIEYWQNAFPDLELTFTMIGYSVTFVDWDGTILKTQDVISGGRASPPASLSRPSTTEYEYSFNGWDNEYTNITADTICTAIYLAYLRRYTVRFYNGDTLLQERSVPYGTKALYTGGTFSKEHENPDLYYWIFDSWYPLVDCITGDVSVFAQWEEKSYLSFQSIDYPSDINTKLIVSCGEDADLIFAFSPNTAPRDLCYVTSDLINWTPFLAPDYASSIDRIKKANGKYFILEDGSGSGGRCLTYSTDGVNWRDTVSLTDAEWGGNGVTPSDIVWDGTNYIVTTAVGKIYVITEDLSMCIAKYVFADEADYYLYFDDAIKRIYIYPDFGSIMYYSDIESDGYFKSMNELTYYTHATNSALYQTTCIINGMWYYIYNNQLRRMTIDLDAGVCYTENMMRIQADTSWRISRLKEHNGTMIMPIYHDGEASATLAMTTDGTSYIVKTYSNIPSFYYLEVTPNYIISQYADKIYYALNTL